jgi:hypothetical protein
MGEDNTRADILSGEHTISTSIITGIGFVNPKKKTSWNQAKIPDFEGYYKYSRIFCSLISHRLNRAEKFTHTMRGQKAKYTGKRIGQEK